MKKIFLLCAVAVLSAVLVSCSKKSSDDGTTPGFTDNLKLGTGMNAADFTLTGEGTSFSVNPGIIYFRLESKDDMAGSNVTIQLYADSSGVFVPRSTFNYTNPQSNGHIFMASFTVKSTGSYRATGILETGSKTIASVDFSVN